MKDEVVADFQGAIAAAIDEHAFVAQRYDAKFVELRKMFSQAVLGIAVHRDAEEPVGFQHAPGLL